MCPLIHLILLLGLLEDHKVIVMVTSHLAGVLQRSPSVYYAVADEPVAITKDRT